MTTSTDTDILKIRDVIRESLNAIIKREFPQKRSEAYARKLESEIFSKYYFSVEVYKEKADCCIQALDEFFRDEGVTDSLFVTAIDYRRLIDKFTPFLGDTKMNSLNFLNQLQEGAQNRPEREDLSSGSKRKGIELIYQRSCGSESGEIDDLEFLEEVTKIKEEEIRSLKELMKNIERENETLKETLYKIKDDLNGLETG